MSLIDVIKAKLVEDAAEWHRWWSMRWIIVAAVVEALRQGWAELPAEWLAWLPSFVPHTLGFMALAATAAAGVARVTKQKDKA